jgi:secretion/DNA translocation related TadE-like protein
MPPKSDSEAGFATVFAVTVVTALAALLVMMLSVGSWLLARTQAASVADIAALAAATRGSCEAAHQVALINDARVRSCTWQGSDVVVVIQTQVSGPAAAIAVHQVEASARAGF